MLILALGALSVIQLFDSDGLAELLVTWIALALSPVYIASGIRSWRAVAEMRRTVRSRRLRWQLFGSGGEDRAGLMNLVTIEALVFLHVVVTPPYLYIVKTGSYFFYLLHMVALVAFVLGQINDRVGRYGEVWKVSGGAP